MHAADHPKKISVTLGVLPNQVDELTAAWTEIILGKPPRETRRTQDQAEIRARLRRC